MPKISALPPMITPDGDDEVPGVDDSTSSTKKFTFNFLRNWLQSLAAWITKSNIDFDSGIWWEELGRASASSGTTMEIASMPTKKFLKVILIDTGSGANGTDIIFNNDTGNSYATTRTLDGAPFSSAVSQPKMEWMGNYKGMQMSTADIINYASLEKVCSVVWVSGPRGGTRNSAAQLPVHGEYATKWANASVQIDRIKATRKGGSYAAGSELVVLGHD